jgi:ABC-type Na+ efflux pump permease subunit
MSTYVVIVIVVLLLVFVPISLVPLFFEKPDDDLLVQMRE